MPDHATTVVGNGTRASVHSAVASPAIVYPWAHTHRGGLDSCEIVPGTTGLHDDFGNTFSERFTVGISTGFTCVNVQLSGWNLDFTSKDHHIDSVSVRISEIDYDKMNGDVTFLVNGTYRDKNKDDDFRWEVWYTVLALG